VNKSFILAKLPFVINEKTYPLVAPDVSIPIVKKHNMQATACRRKNTTLLFFRRN